MRTPYHVLLSAAFAAALAGALTAGDAGRVLKYQFKPGETYVYKIDVAGELGAVAWTAKGTVQLKGKSADANQITLTPSANITTQTRQPSTPGKKGFGPPKMPFDKGFGKPKTGGTPELTIDLFGKLLRTSAEKTRFSLRESPRGLQRKAVACLPVPH